MEDWEIASFFTMLSGGANDTTANLSAMSLYLLDRNPDQKAWLLEDFDARIDNAVEELLRLVPPLMHFRRTATQDYTLGGAQIKAGDKVVLWYASGCQDEDVFTDPLTLDLSAQRRGARRLRWCGPHYCLGAELGRQLVKSTLREVYDQLDDFKVGEPEFKNSNFINGIRSVPVSWTPRH